MTFAVSGCHARVVLRASCQISAQAFVTCALLKRMQRIQPIYRAVAERLSIHIESQVLHKVLP